MDLDNKIKELKAHVYDEISKLEDLQMQQQIIQNGIKQLNEQIKSLIVEKNKIEESKKPDV